MLTRAAVKFNVAMVQFHGNMVRACSWNRATLFTAEISSENQDWYATIFQIFVYLIVCWCQMDAAIGRILIISE